MPITPKTGSLFHADPQRLDSSSCGTRWDHQFEAPLLQRRVWQTRNHQCRPAVHRSHKDTSSGYGTAPLRCRLSDTTRPSFRTSCRRRTLVMSSSGLSATTIRSASLPTSNVPSSAPTPHTSAPWRVAPTSVCHSKARRSGHVPPGDTGPAGRDHEIDVVINDALIQLRDDQLLLIAHDLSGRDPVPGITRSASESPERSCDASRVSETVRIAMFRRHRYCNRSPYACLRANFRALRGARVLGNGGPLCGGVATGPNPARTDGRFQVIFFAQPII
jgi:hypothetical protein